MNPTPETGKVYLVGAGPGDPGLITKKAIDCIHNADVVIYDYLAAPALLQYTTDAVEKIYVGKKGGDHTLSQAGINALIVEKAAAGRTVTRLKGGDPFIFGRGGEEARELATAGIDFEIVPGVTSAIAAPAYAGIPLTHRQLASTLTFVTGHEDPAKHSSQINWQALASGGGTLVFLMGVKNLPHITDQLRKHGLADQTPVALVRWGTTTRQVTVSGTLETIAARVIEAGLKAPAVIVVGNVVTLRKELKWFEKRPLWGKRIVVTRARQQASNLVKQLSALGAECLEVPTIRIIPPASWNPIDRAIATLSTYHWLIFTSVNGVTFFFERLLSKGLDARALAGLHTAAIGPATASRLRHYGLRSDVVPKNYRAEGMVEAFAHHKLAGTHILLPRAKAARPVLPVELERMGAHVDEIAIYETVASNEEADTLIRALENHSVDLVTFTSSSTVKNFRARLPEPDFERLMNRITVASIGPITTQTAEKLGFTVAIEADEFTIDGLCSTIVDHFHEPQTD